jgi:hypothetical protein
MLNTLSTVIQLYKNGLQGYVDGFRQFWRIRSRVASNGLSRRQFWQEVVQEDRI